MQHCTLEYQYTSVVHRVFRMRYLIQRPPRKIETQTVNRCKTGKKWVSYHQKKVATRRQGKVNHPDTFPPLKPLTFERENETESSAPLAQPYLETKESTSLLVFMKRRQMVERRKRYNSTGRLQLKEREKAPPIHHNAVDST